VKRLFVFTFLFLFFYIPFSAFGTPENTVHIKADNIIYNKKLNVYYAKGHCVIYTQAYTIKSNAASYFKNSSLAQVEGNVTIENKKGDWIKGSSGTINTSTFKGFIDNATMFIKSDDIYIKAKRIIMNSKEKYYISEGTITGCKCPQFIRGNPKAHPKWSIWAKNTYVVKNDYIFSYPVVFKARNIPLFFSPVLSRSLANKRKTGFLFPALGYSSKDGIKYVQPFFINISPSQDVTLKPFINTFSGYGLESQYRFYWTKHSKGKWDITLFKEKKPYGTSDNKKLRVYTKAVQQADLAQYGNFSYDINIVNNKDNLRVLNRDNIEISSDRYTTSKAFYSITKGVYSLNINGYFYQDLIADNNRETLQKLPEIKFDITNKKLWNNLTLDFDQTATNNFRIEGNRGYSSSTTGFLSYPFKISYFSIVPKIGAHELYAYWENAPSNNHFSRRSFIPEYSINTKTSLYRVFTTNNTDGLVALKHTVNPSLTYTYIPQRDQSKFPDFVSEYSKTNNINFTLENILTTKNRDNSTISYREFFYNKISQEYDFTKEYHTPFPPLYEETRFSPLTYLSFASKAHFSTYKGMFTDSDEEININTKTKGASFGYVMSRDSNYKINNESAKATLYLYPIKNLYTYVYVERSLNEGYYPQKKVGFMYNEDCWGIGLDLYVNRIAEENSDGTYSRRKNIGFWVTISLKGIGTVKKQY